MKHAMNSEPKQEMVDISSSSARHAAGGSRYANEGGGGSNKKKIIIAASIAAGVVAVGAVAFVLFGMNGGSGSQEKVDDTPKEFTFAESTMVSGVDISGKTMKEAKALLESNKKSFIKPVKLSVEVVGDTVELTQDNFEYTYDIDKVLGQAKADAESSEPETGKVYTVTATVTEDSIKKQADDIGSKYSVEPVNAYVSEFHPYSDDRFEFKGEIDGYIVDSEDLLAKLKTGIAGGQAQQKIEAKTDTAKAEVTADFLKKNIVELASYETYSSNTENGTSNMRVALEACNGSIIDPGEQWSFNECTGDSNLESNGYKSANVISEGKVIQGIGGGICQSSSTIYNAAILSNMGIVERYPHQWASYYVPTGLDATIDYPNLDLTLENTSKYQMFLECKAVDTRLTATFWGYQSPDYDEIRIANQMGEVGSSSYNVSAWRIFYKNGEKVKVEDLPSSNYDNDNGIVFYPAEEDASAAGASTETANTSAGGDSYDYGSGGGDTGYQSQESYVYTETYTEAPPVYVQPETEAIVPEITYPEPVVENPQPIQP